MYKLSKKSKVHYDTLDPKLQLIVDKVLKIYDISIICGHRNMEDQNKAFDSKHSKLQWPNSKHNSLPSTAMDIVPYPIDWENIEEFYYMAGIVMAVAEHYFIKLKWGGRFKSFFDGPHFEIVE